MNPPESYSERIVATYLYVTTRYGYPPDPAGSAGHLQEFRDLGFRSIELEGIREEHLEGMAVRKEELRTKAAELGLQVPVFCVVLPGLSSPDGKERERNLALFEKGCDLAAALGSKAVLDNAPLPPWQFPEGIPVTRHYDEDVLARATLPADLDWNAYWDGLVGTFRQACEVAAGRGLTYQLHPCHGALVDSADAYLLFSGAVKRDNLRFNFDTANQFFLRENLALALRRLEGHLDYIHVSDNRGHRVEHLAIGAGKIDWDALGEALERIGFGGYVGIDVGGAESDVPDLDGAYTSTADWLEKNWMEREEE